MGFNRLHNRHFFACGAGVNTVASSVNGKDNWPTALQLPTYLHHVCSKQRLRVPGAPGTELKKKAIFLQCEFITV